MTTCTKAKTAQIEQDTESQLNHSTHADLCSQIFCFMCISYGFISYDQ